ncbi:MAG: 4,5-DOPA dioxygenase extradiol [Thermoanaerobaculia bacterium]
MPAVFFGHGNPLNAIQQNAWTAEWSAIGRAMPRPRAIISVSAHWYLPGTMVTAVETPRTIHDFGGFPRPLYQVEYPAAGDLALCARVREVLAPIETAFDTQWGLDHGTWSVLVHVFPDAGVPVVQLSIDETLPPAEHYAIGKRLAPLRDEGILVMGTGNLVHNLHAYAWGRHPARPFDWAVRFEAKARELIAGGNHAPLVEYEELGGDAMLSAPTPDHYLPLLYVLGAAQPGDDVTFPVEGVDGGSVSMLAVSVG